MSSESMNTRLKLHILAAGMKTSQGDLSYSMNSFRSRGPTSHFLEGISLESIMNSAYWKNPKMAMHYIKPLEVLGPFQYDKKSISPADYARLNNLPLLESNNRLKTYPSKWFTST